MGRPKLNQPFVEKYWQQKQNARRRGIPFEFTYDAWIEWWGDDIHNRGKGKDKLVMARHNDSGAYHPNNVIKMFNQENVSQGNLGRIFSDRHRENLSVAMTKGVIDDKHLLHRSEAIKAFCQNKKNKETI